MNAERAKEIDVDYELLRFVRRTRVQTMAALSDLHPDLDYNTFIMLLPIADSEDGIRATKLAEDLHVHKSTISRAVATLERIGMIERTPDPLDGRAQLLTARSEAKDKLEAFRARGADYFEGLMQDWTTDERGFFAQMLRRLNDKADSVTA